MILKHISRMLCLLISYSKFTRTKLNDLVDFSFHLFYILYRKGIVVVLKNEIPYSKCLNGVLRFFFYIILAILHLERGH